MNESHTMVFGVVLSSYIMSAIFIALVSNFARVGIVSYDEIFPMAIKHNWLV